MKNKKILYPKIYNFVLDRLSQPTFKLLKLI